MCSVCFVIICFSHSFGASGRLCFMIVVFPRYLHLPFCVLSVILCLFVLPLAVIAGRL